MKLDLDLVRDILFLVEDNTNLTTSLYLVNIPLMKLNLVSEEEMNAIHKIPDIQYALMDKYGEDELLYHIFYCADAGLISISTRKNDFLCKIDDLTPSGHELLGRLRSDTVFAQAKEIILNGGINSLAELGKIAARLAAEHLTTVLKSVL